MCSEKKKETRVRERSLLKWRHQTEQRSRSRQKGCAVLRVEEQGERTGRGRRLPAANGKGALDNSRTCIKSHGITWLRKSSFQCVSGLPCTRVGLLPHHHYSCTTSSGNPLSARIEKIAEQQWFFFFFWGGGGRNAKECRSLLSNFFKNRVKTYRINRKPVIARATLAPYTLFAYIFKMNIRNVQIPVTDEALFFFQKSIICFFLKYLTVKYD